MLGFPMDSRMAPRSGSKIYKSHVDQHKKLKGLDALSGIVHLKAKMAVGAGHVTDVLFYLDLGIPAAYAASVLGTWLV